MAVDLTNLETISVSGLRRIGAGGTCTVFALGDSLALKAFHASIPHANILTEYEGTRAAWEAGIPTARPCKVVAIPNEGFGLGVVLERLEGRTVAEEVEDGTTGVLDASRRMGALLRRLHETQVHSPALPNQQAVLAGYARRLSGPEAGLLRDNEAEGLARLFEALPQSDGFLHGDYHMNNVMHVVRGGKDAAALIDLAGAGHGHPLLDWAGTFQACRLIPDYVDPTACKRFIGLGAEKARAMLLPMMESYYDTTDKDTLHRSYRLMEALGYAKYACMVVREPNPWIDRQRVARQLREHVISQLEELMGLLAG